MNQRLSKLLAGSAIAAALTGGIGAANAAAQSANKAPKGASNKGLSNQHIQGELDVTLLRIPDSRYDQETKVTMTRGKYWS